VNQLSSLTVPLMIIQGTDDYLVDLNQACEKRTALSASGNGPASWYFDPNLNLQNPANVCGGSFETTPAPGPAAWTQNDYFLVFEGQGHGFTGAANQYAAGAALYFLLAHL
jgi:hypothetical protein